MKAAPRNVHEPSPSTRETILKSATAIFADVGYDRASLATVADGLGITRQAFYYHFRGKGDILGALFNRAMTLVEAEASRNLLQSGKRRYLEMLGGHLRVVMANLDLMKITIHDRHSIDALGGVESVNRRATYAGWFVTAYADGVDAGALRQAHAGLMAQSNLGTLNAICTWWDPERGPAASAVHSLLMTTLELGLVAHSR